MASKTIKQIIGKAFIGEENLNKLPILEFSTNFAGYLSKKFGEDQSVVLENAGPSLNMKVAGGYGYIPNDSFVLNV